MNVIAITYRENALAKPIKFVLYIILFTGYRSILALCSLVYLIPDVRTKVDHNKVAILIEVSLTLNTENSCIKLVQFVCLQALACFSDFCVASSTYTVEPLCKILWD